METIEDIIVRELKTNYEGIVKDLIKKVTEAVSGHDDLLMAYIGDELRFFMMDNYTGENLENRLIRIGLAYIDWDEIAEKVFEEVI